MIKHVVLYLFLLSCTCLVQAQDFNIRGTVFEEETGMGLMGAAVLIEGTTNGAQTDMSGSFSLTGVKAGDKLVVSFIGMKTEIIPITNQNRSSEIIVRLKNDNYQLEQVVVTGYGTARKRDLTGVIVSVSGEELKNAPTNNVMSSLQGKIPGPHHGNHMNRNGLCTIVAFNKEVNEQLAKQIAMQIAAMNPIAIDEDGVSEEVKQKEIEVAIEKTKAEQVQKAVEAALKKANINPAHVDSEEHMESNMAKGWITAEDVAKAKEIIATVSAEKAAHLPEQMIQNIAKGRLGKFLKEVCLLNQEDIMDAKKTVREVLAAADPELKIVDFKRFTLKAE